MDVPDSIADEITEKQSKAWARIYSATERCVPESPLDEVRSHWQNAQKRIAELEAEVKELRGMLRRDYAERR